MVGLVVEESQHYYKRLLFRKDFDSGGYWSLLLCLRNFTNKNIAKGKAGKHAKEIIPYTLMVW